MLSPALYCFIVDFNFSICPSFFILLTIVIYITCLPSDFIFFVLTSWPFCSSFIDVEQILKHCFISYSKSFWEDSSLRSLGCSSLSLILQCFSLASCGGSFLFIYPQVRTNPSRPCLPVHGWWIPLSSILRVVVLNCFPDPRLDRDWYAQTTPDPMSPRPAHPTANSCLPWLAHLRMNLLSPGRLALWYSKLASPVLPLAALP